MKSAVILICSLAILFSWTSCSKESKSEASKDSKEDNGILTPFIIPIK